MLPYATTNAYDASGLLSATTSANHRYRGGSIYENTPDTAYAYTARADGQAASVTFRPDTSQPGTGFTTTYGYDANQHLTSAQINDGRPRRVEYVNDAQGQVLVRREADNTAYSAGTGKGGDPRAYNYYLNGIQVGSNSNNGNPDPDFGTALGERVARPTNGTGAFALGADAGSTYADFDQAFDAVNASNSGNGTARYTVRQGDSLQSIAASLFGDASLWYIIGEANGLTSTSALSAGQSLTIPGKIANFHNNADTFRPYDASKAIGDTAPTTPRPPKKANGCGVFGQILLAAVAIAVTAIIAPAGAPLLTQIGAAVAGSVVSQGVGLATGIQDKFSFKGVALAALSAGIGGGGSAGGIVGKVVRGAVSSAITQGIAVAVGLQDKFSFAGVAAAGIAAGVGGALSSRLGPASNTLARAGQTALVGTSALIASAGARSLISGTNFGDNIVAGLPDVIGQTVGGFAADKVNDARNDKRAERLANSEDVPESLRGTKEAAAYARDLLSAGARASTVAQEFKNGSAAAAIASAQAGDIVVTAQRGQARGLGDFGAFSAASFKPGQDAGAQLISASNKIASNSNKFESFDPRNPANYSNYSVKQGDSISSIAELRKGLAVDDLVDLNQLKNPDLIEVDQILKLPNQNYLDAGREARSKFINLAYYIKVHDGALPPDLSNPPDILDPVNSISIESNGYIFKQDALLRTREVSGTLTLNSNQGRSRSAQILAGGADRLPTDQGGHLIGRRFGGPSGLINLFAQDATINNSAYRILENSFEKAIRAGSSVRVNVTPLYKGSSLRPSSINVIYYIDNQRQIANIPNPSIGR